MEAVDIDILIKHTDSIFKLVVLTARRAVELDEGAPKLVSAPLNEKTINVALKEIGDGKISYTVNE